MIDSIIQLLLDRIDCVILYIYSHSTLLVYKPDKNFDIGCLVGI